MVSDTDSSYISLEAENVLKATEMACSIANIEIDAVLQVNVSEFKLYY